MKIAEIGLCHDGNMELAIKLIELSKKQGFNAVKFQKRSAGKWFNDPTPRPDSPFGKNVGEHRHHLELTPGQHKVLQEAAHRNNLKYGCSVWDVISAMEIMEILNPDKGDFLKIGRPSNNDSPLIQEIGDLYLQKILKKSKLPKLVVSCRNENEKKYIETLLKKTSPSFDLLYNLEISYLYCPGNYPDREKDLPENLPEWSDGYSLHHTDPNFGKSLENNRGYVVTERHVALNATKHRDKQWSIILD